MKKTKLVASLLAATLALTSITGCGNDSGEQPSNDDKNNITGSDNSNKDNNNESNNNSNNGNNESNDKDPGTAAAELAYADGTVLRMATGYNSKDTGITFSADVAGEGITLANGKTYNSGDLKPTWETVQEKLNIKFDDKYQGNSSANEFDYWKEQLDQVDMVSGTATLLTENGEAGLLINLANYLDSMPNFKAYLEKNPIVRLSITGSTTGDKKGAIYFSPYFDGVNDIERMPLMRVDWVQKLLDGEGQFTAANSGTTAAPVYQPYMPTSGKIEIEVVRKDTAGTETVAKDYDAAGNIIATMNAKGSMSGVEAVNMLREYIDKAYNGYYGTTRSDLFIGQNAAWDADELVALLRCVVSNAQTLNGTDSVQGLFSREDDNNQRRVDMFRFAGSLFGVRGLESRQDYFYVGTDGHLHDARQEADTYVALERMNAMAQEGLISKAYLDSSKESSATYLENDNGFMHYDYNQTQTLYNATKLQAEDGEKYMAAMVPVARWYDGTSEDGVYMRFTESWRSVKTDGWGISVKGVGSDTNKLNAALKLIDYAFSAEGQILMSYGPDEFIKKGETFKFNGQDMPVISDETYAELWEKAGGNYTNYARKYLGSTLSFVKSQAFEYQCTHEVGREGAGYISNAIGMGTIKHPQLALTDNAWYTSVPTVLPNTKTENDLIAGYTELGSKGRFGQNKEGQNLFVDIICNGYTGEGTSSAAETVDTVINSWNGKQYLNLKESAWQRLVDYYNEIN